MPSTVVAHIDYDAARLLLTIHFVSGAIYEYQQVPEAVFLSLKQSREKGIYLNRFIKGKYNFKKINTQ